MGRFGKYSIRVFILLVILIIIPFKAAHAETLEEYMNNLVGPKQQYNTMLSPAYLRNNENEVSVNPQNGELTVKQTDYVLPGRNGLDLKIERIYKNDN